MLGATDQGRVDASVVLRGGNGSLRGGDALATGSMDGETSGDVFLRKEATAGSGLGLAGADGGEAWVELDNGSGASQSVTGSARAFGGDGGQGRDTGAGPVAGGDGGRASIVGHLRNHAGPVELTALAEGGSGGRGDDAGGRGGDAEVAADTSVEGDAGSIHVGFGGGAYGGRGGDFDRSASAGSVAGAGGGAYSGSSGVAGEGLTTVQVIDQATGGRGGDLSGGAGRGGAGGEASSSAFAANGGGAAQTVQASATARGGQGGSGLYPDADGGDGGTAVATARGMSSPGGGPDAGTSDVRVIALQLGGAGGDGRNGGDGASSTLIDAVSGATRGLLTLEERAFGGDGGRGAVQGGRAGDAHAGLVASNPDGGALSMYVSALGGDGGDGPDGGGRDGGAATLGEVRGFSDSGADVSVTGVASGGDGGSGGGAAASVELENAIDADTAGSIALLQAAVGGRPGGHGRSTLRVEKSALSLAVEARGFGGGATGTGHAGEGEAHARSTNLGGDASARAWGSGGGTSGSSVAPGGVAGDALAEAVSEAPVGDAFAEAIADGGLAAGVGSTGGSAQASASARGAGAVESFADAHGGAGASVGTADARAEGHGLADDSVFVSATAQGGDARDAAGAGEVAGEGGAVESRAEGRSDGAGRVEVQATLLGGRGGDASDGATAGDGTSIVQVDRASGATAGQLVLSQYVEGGTGGSAFDADSVSGAGGDVSSSLTAANDGGGDLRLTVVAQGGRAGGGGVSPASGGDARAEAVGFSGNGARVEVGAQAIAGESLSEIGAASLGRVHGESNGGAVHVSGIVRGGSAAFSLGQLSSSPPLQGGDVALVDAVDGRTTGSLRLDQLAVGGTGRGGLRGGTASSLLTRSDAVERLTLYSAAKAGGGDAAIGADAHAEAWGRNEAGYVLVYGAAQGGSGVERSGDAYVRAYGRTDRDGDRVQVGVEGAPPSTFPPLPPGSILEAFAFENDLTASAATGGSGAGVEASAAGARAGDGGAAWSEGEGDARGDAEVDVFDRALGGDAGRLWTQRPTFPLPPPGDGIVAEGGRGGDAHSTATAQGGGESLVHASANAMAGNGSATERPRFPFPSSVGRDDVVRGAGGDATATALARGAGAVEAEANALAGRSGAGQASGVAAAQATAEGASGHADATALADDARLELLTRATAAVGSSAHASARSAIGRDPGIVPPAGVEAWSHAWGLPDEGAVAGLLAGTPGVAAHLEASEQGRPELLALLKLGGATSPDHDGSSITMHAEAELALDRDAFAGSVLSIGFLGAAGEELVESVALEIRGDGATLASFVFGDLASAAAALTDAWLELGPVGPGEEDFALSIVLDTTFSGPHADFGARLLVSAVPEPGAGILLGFALLAWARRRRAR